MIADWEIQFDPAHGTRVLCHKCDPKFQTTYYAGWLAWKGAESNRKWQCCYCDAVAPEEIQFVADLAGCWSR